jgi:hypothetical protein
MTSSDPGRAAAPRAPAADPVEGSVAALTCSFRGDIEAFAALAASMDAVAPALRHLVVVPRRDLGLFRRFERPGRDVTALEALLPRTLWRAPIPGGRWRRLAGLSHREIYLLGGRRRVGGWIVQQVVKLRAAAEASEAVILHVDSDVVLLRAPTAAALTLDGRVRLYRNPAIGPREPHGEWHLAAARLLGLPETRYFGAGYIDNLVTWRSDVARALLAAVARRAGRAWDETLLGLPALSEYILYGVFCDHVLGEAGGHFGTDQSLALTCWAEDMLTPAALAALEARMTPGHLAFAAQSTLPLGPEARASLAARMAARARAQDAVAAPA